MRSRDELVEDLAVQAYMAEYLTPPGDIVRAANSTVWATALQEIPTENLEAMFYGAMLHEPGRAPRPHDLIAAWQRHVAALPTMTFQEQEAAFGRNQLPQAPEGPGRRAFVLLGERLNTGKGNVACHCRDACELSDDSETWLCKVRVCGFTWPVADTMNAPYSSKPGGLAQGLGPVNVAAVTREMVQEWATEREKKPDVLHQMADDSGIDLDSCTPEQVNMFRAFAKWWRAQFECKLTPVLFREQWPVFAAEQTQAATA